MFSFRGVNKSVIGRLYRGSYSIDRGIWYSLSHWSTQSACDLFLQPEPQVGYTVYKCITEILRFFGHNPSPVRIPFQQNRVNFVSWCLSLFTFFFVGCVRVCVWFWFLTRQKKHWHVFGKRGGPLHDFWEILCCCSERILCPKRLWPWLTFEHKNSIKSWRYVVGCHDWWTNQPTPP